MVDIPNSDGTIGESTEQSGTLGVPLEGSALLEEGLLVLTHGDVLGGLVLKGLKWLELLVLEVPDEDSSVGGSGQPLVGWVELEVVHLGFGVESDSGFLKAVNVPDLDEVVFTAGGNVFASWGNTEG